MLVAAGLTLAGCAQHPSTSAKTSVETPKIKNVILMIGDGMGPQQVGLLEEFAHRAKHSPYQNKTTALSTFAAEGALGMSRHSPFNNLVVDSACSATQLATGISSDSEMIGLDANGDTVMTVLEHAKKLGKATGLVSDTRLTHATPASFATHQAHRSMENEIAAEMITSDNVDVMLSGGLRHFIPSNSAQDAAAKQALTQLINEPALRLKSKRKDNRNLLVEAKDQGYNLAFNREQLQQSQGNKLLGLFAYSGMNDGIAYHQQKNSSERNEPSLKEMTMKALDILSQDPDGFFLMVEGGQIDWAGHNNDAGTLLHEMLKFDEAVAAVHEWVKKRNDTLVVITADHETGGFGFSYSRKDVPVPSKKPGASFANHDFQPNYNFGDIAVLDKLYEQQKSYFGIWAEAAGKDAFPTAQSLTNAVKNNTAFELTLNEAEQVLAREANDYHLASHKYLKAKEFPKVNDFKEYYVYGDDVHKNLIGRQLAKYQNIVWSTGTHTHTPVAVIAWGPDNVNQVFSKIQHHTDIGKKLITAVTTETLQP